MAYMIPASLVRCASADARAKILAEILQCALHGERRHAAQPAQRALHHGLTQILEQLKIALAVDAFENAIDDLHPARRADAARGALAARFDGAELHRVARHARHVDAVVERHDAAVSEQRADA